MGGKALKSTAGNRLDVRAYRALADEVLTPLRAHFPQASDVPSYRTKPDFGDLDILIEHDGPMEEMEQKVREIFKPEESLTNGNCISMAKSGFQVDLIAAKNFDMAMVYFAYNDLGNMIGTVAHGFGLKLGPSGITLPVRINDGSTELGRLMVTEVPEQVLGFLGYDPDVHKRGFDTIGDIFKYATSSPYFDPGLFGEDKMNHQSRARQRKRPITAQFLEHIATTPGLQKYEFNDNPESYFDKIAGEFPSAKLKEGRASMISGYERQSKNRDRLRAFLPEIPLQGKALGTALDGLRSSMPDFQEFMEKGSDEEIRAKLRTLG
jgi:hypothetical protein